jgi:hypothetical protein
MLPENGGIVDVPASSNLSLLSAAISSLISCIVGVGGLAAAIVGVGGLICLFVRNGYLELRGETVPDGFEIICFLLFGLVFVAVVVSDSPLV